MSIKRMVMKLALAFAAKKGMDAFRGIGGVEGVRSAMRDMPQASTSSASRSQSDGIGNIIQKLGLGGGSSAGSSGSVGAVIGSLASALGVGGSRPVENDTLDKQFAQTDPVHDQDAEPVLRAMVQMARADGAIDEREQAALFDILDDASDNEKAVLTAALREPIDPTAIANDTPAHARREVYSAALLIGQPDTHAEKSFLETLARSLGLQQHDVDALHNAMGKPSVRLS